MDKIEWYQLGHNLIILIAACAAAFYFNIKDPFERGFFCDDLTIKYPFTEYEAVSFVNLITIVFILPLVLIIAFETIHFFLIRKKFPFQDVQFFWQTSLLLIDWLFALMLLLIVENLIKVMSGCLRPMFLDACGLLDFCKQPANLGQYISNVSCNSTVFPVDQLRKSFPSGHAAESMGSMAYLAFYLHKRQKDHHRLSVIVLQFILIIVSLYTGLTRIQENKHHPQDVLAGFLLGLLIPLTSAKLTARLDYLPTYVIISPKPTDNSFTEVELT